MQLQAGAEPENSSSCFPPPAARFSLLGVPCSVIPKDSNQVSRRLIGELQLFGRRFVVVLDPTSTPPPRQIDAGRCSMSRLTRREREIAVLVAQGWLTKQIAHELGLSPHTVTAYVKRIFAKLSVHNRAEMVAATLSEFS
jgi:DNA-binding NarL/FixJ family response regulator